MLAYEPKKRDTIMLTEALLPGHRSDQEFQFGLKREHSRRDVLWVQLISNALI